MARTRLINSRFQKYHIAQMVKWRMMQWSSGAIDVQRDEVLAAVQTLVTAYCRTEGLAAADGESFVRQLREIATPKRRRGQQEVRVEEMAIILWTAADPITLWHPRKGKIELCYIINQALRADGETSESQTSASAAASSSADSAANDSPLLAPAILLTCMMQLHINATRRTGYHEHERWPCGPRVAEKKGKSTEKDTVFRGSALPNKHKAFFDEMLRNKQVYRVPMLLATSFDITGVNTTFLDNDRHGNQPRVRWTVKLDPTNRCRHANFIVRSEVSSEKELLFSAYSTFTVEAITWSPTPTRPTTPHEIVIRARPDNSVEPIDVPCAPWH
jgi:hypothetical protein